MVFPATCSTASPIQFPEENRFSASGHTAKEKTDLLKQLCSMFQDLSETATEQLALSLQEIPLSNAMEMGQS
jgi:hypothetical protein